MKRVVLVLYLLMMSLFVSGYTYEVEMKISGDNKVVLNKTFSMKKDEITKVICGEQQCEYGDDQIKNAIIAYINSDTVNESVRESEEITIDDEKVEVYHSYELNDIDDHVGPGYDSIDLLHSNFNYDLFTINGLNYKSNLSFTPEESLTYGTFKVVLPYKMSECNATKKDDKNYTYEWDLTSSPKISFVYKAEGNKEIVGDSEYGKIKFNKNMFIALGVIVGLIVILSFVNIIKKDKNKQKEVQPSENTPVFNSEVFNNRASVTKPSDMSEGEDTFVPLDETKHEDKISNKFLDDSFAGTEKVEDEQSSEPITISSPTSVEPAKEETPIAEPITEEKPIEQPESNPVVEPMVEEPIVEEKPIEQPVTEVVEEQPSEPIQNDMSALAFGGAPIEDKNINEIE